MNTTGAGLRTALGRSTGGSSNERSASCSERFGETRAEALYRRSTIGCAQISTIAWSTRSPEVRLVSQRTLGTGLWKQLAIVDAVGHSGAPTAARRSIVRQSSEGNRSAVPTVFASEAGERPADTVLIRY